MRSGVKKYKPIKNLILKPCCVKTLGVIRKRIIAAKLLQQLLVPLVFANLFLGPSGPGTGLKLALDIEETDWVLLAQAVRAIPDIMKKVIRDDAAYEILDHDMAGDRELKDFWQGIRDAF